MRKIKIRGYAYQLPKNTVTFGENVRYRITDDENQLELSVAAAKKVLDKENLTGDDLDCIIFAGAVGVQPIPCTAALIHERIAKGTSVPAIDINTTCTSFISALDTMSYLVEAGRYNRILIVSCDTGSIALNPNQKESYELFSDGAAAFLFEGTKEAVGVIAATQNTFSEGAHSTEIRAGLTGYHPKYYSEKTKEEYMFDMKGREILVVTARHITKIWNKFMEENNLPESYQMVVPHQASVALPMIMKRLGVPVEKYIDGVQEYGNMVSASVPFALCKGLESGSIQQGDTVILLGTAAGLTINILALKL